MRDEVSRKERGGEFWQRFTLPVEEKGVVFVGSEAPM